MKSFITSSSTKILEQPAVPNASAANQEEFRKMFPYDFFKFNPEEDSLEDTLQKACEMRNKTLNFFTNYPKYQYSKIISETVKLLDDKNEISADNQRIEASLQIFYQEGLVLKFGDIYMSNKPPTSAVIDQSACEQALGWRCEYGAKVFGQESLGAKPKNHKELKTLILKTSEGVQAFIGSGDNQFSVDARHPLSQIDLKAKNLIPYTVNPGAITMLGDKLDRIHLDESLKGAEFLTNNCGSRFLSYCVKAAPLIKVMENIAQQIQCKNTPTNIISSGVEAALNLASQGDHKKSHHDISK